MAKFSDVLTIVNGKNQGKVENPNGRYPIYGSGGIMGYADSYLCKPNTVVIGRKGNINKPIFVETPFWNVDTAFGLEAKTDILLPKYLYYYCVHYDFEKLNTTVTIPSLTKANLLQIEMPVPSIDEQREIVDNLDKVEQLISLRKKQLQKLDDLVKSRFVEMFGDPVSNAKGWKQELLHNVTSKIGSGATPKGGKESYQTDGISLIRSMNVHDGRFEYKELAHISEEQAQQLNNVTVEENDVFINITGASVARSCIVPDNVLPARVNQHVAIIRCKHDQLHPVFANNLFLSSKFKEQLLSIGESGGATRQAITKQQLETLIVIVPPIELQNKFADIVKRIETSRLTICQSLDKLEQMKQALMQKYFG